MSFQMQGKFFFFEKQDADKLKKKYTPRNPKDVAENKSSKYK